MMKTTLYTYEISTVALGKAYEGMNLGKYETMIRTYKDEWLDYTSRYDTEEEAISFYSNQENYELLNKGDIGENLSKKYLAKGLFIYSDVISTIFYLIKKFIKI